MHKRRRGLVHVLFGLTPGLPTPFRGSWWVRYNTNGFLRLPFQPVVVKHASDPHYYAPIRASNALPTPFFPFPAFAAATPAPPPPPPPPPWLPWLLAGAAIFSQPSPPPPLLLCPPPPVPPPPPPPTPTTSFRRWGWYRMPFCSAYFRSRSSAVNARIVSDSPK